MRNKFLILLFCLLGLLVVALFLRFSPFTKTDSIPTSSDASIPDYLSDMPVYPNAKFEKIVDRRVTWITSDPTLQVTDWYLEMLQKTAWVITEIPDDRGGVEQIIKISKDNLTGYVAAEDEGNSITEIVVWTQDVK